MIKAIKNLRKAIHVLSNEGGVALYKIIKNKYFYNEHNEYVGIAPFEAEYQDNEQYDLSSIDVKAVAFYLPQYHSFPENDIWWGKGFTEWSNTKRCHRERFYNHYQPRTPHKDIGYYDLSDFNVMKKQIGLAKEHGIYGFCYYYYWFSGKRLMELPVDQLLEHPEVNFPFCLCWANENWTRTWDGQKKNVLIEQKYSDNDPELFIRDIKKYVDDKRYIRINGKPLLIVYNPGEIPNCAIVFKKWREEAHKLKIGDILIWVCATANNNVENLNLADYVDAEVEFPPHNMWNQEFAIHSIDLKGKKASIFDYRKIVKWQLSKLAANNNYCVPIHHSCTLGWDNSARRKNNWFTLYGFTLKHYYKWLRGIVSDARKNFSEEERFIFINAWNEWAEGTYLEPDEKYGYSYINTTTKALAGIPFDKLPYIYNGEKICRDFTASKVCVQFHIYYVELLEEIVTYLNNITFSYDCYISTDTEEKKKTIEAYFAIKSNCSSYTVEVFENRGRDVRPFLIQLSNLIRKYDYVGHFHSKITKTGNYGDDWRKYCYKHLLGDSNYIDYIFSMFEDNHKLGIVFPPVYPPLTSQAVWGGNKSGCEMLMRLIGLEYQLPTCRPEFPVGNMFWARSAAILPVFERLDFDLFPKEHGQVNATLAHCIERVWGYVAMAMKYELEYIFNANVLTCDNSQYKSIIIYVHYDAENILSKNDYEYLMVLKQLSKKLVVVSNNCDLKQKYKDKLDGLADLVIYRKNSGYDFSAWRDAIKILGKQEIEQYDELILTNNSMVIVSDNKFKQIIEEMNSRTCDFWGMTLFPALQDGSFCNIDYIPEHIQSYFMCFKQSVIKDDAFFEFWNNVQDEDNINSVIAKYETQLTRLLGDLGYKYDVYIKETKYINYMLASFDLLYTKPWIYILLGLPFVKKKYNKLAEDDDIIKTDFYLNNIV